jgi:hypothetical protein
LQWFGTEEVVAEAELNSTNPKALVHHMVLGLDYWRVWVKRVIVKSVPLYRSTSDMRILEDAFGSTLAWPSKYITFDA